MGGIKEKFAEIAKQLSAEKVQLDAIFLEKQITVKGITDELRKIQKRLDVALNEEIDAQNDALQKQGEINLILKFVEEQK